MSFYDPLALPTFEATRLEIERTIMGLEERLLRRKELDLEIEKDLLQQEQLQMHKLSHHLYEPSYQQFDEGYHAEIELQQKLKNLRTFDPRQNYIAAHHISRQALELDYLARLRQIDRQQSLLNQKLLAKNQNLYQNNYNSSEHPFDESGEMLARKYFDGTRAYEYNEELKRSGDKESAFKKGEDTVKEKKNKKLFEETSSKGFEQMQQKRQPAYSSVKKYQSSLSKHDTEQNHQQYQNNQHSLNQSRPSPIKQIENSSRFNSTAGKNAIFHNKEKQVESSYRKGVDIHKGAYYHEKSYQNHYSPEMKSKNIQRSRTKSTQPTNQLIHVAEPIHDHQRSLSRSRPKSSTKSSRYIPNRNYSSKSLHQLSSTKFHLPLLPEESSIEQKFKIWFRDRTRLAEQAKEILEIKYAKNLPDYLLTVYEKQEKFRQDLKEKICKIPQVERKFDVGPVKE